MSASGWHEIRLGDLVEITKGNSYRSVDLGPSTTALVTLKSFERGGGYRHDGLKAFTGQYKPEQVVKPGEVIIALTDVTQAAELVGRPAKVSRSLGFKTLVASVDAGIIRPVSGQIDSQFLYYLLLSPQLKDWTYAHTTGTTVLHLNPNAIKAFVASIPPLSEQREIASTLSALDDKIELNRRMNATLEAMARALFQSWFVDFDPVHAKAEGRQPVGMDAETAALFPDSFEESELGRIPRGWRAALNHELTDIESKAINPALEPEQLFAHYSLPAFDDSQRPELVSGGKIKSNKIVVPKGAVLVSKLNPHIPRVWLTDVSMETQPVCSTEFIVNMPSPLATSMYLYLLYSSQPFTNFYGGLAGGTTGSHQRVRPQDFLHVKVIVPDQKVLATFSSIASTLMDQRAGAMKNNEALVSVRDHLLPKLLSGELRVGVVAA